MTRKATLGIGILVAMSAIALAATSDPMTLKYSPKEGDDIKYKMSGQFVVMNTDATLTADVDYKVTKVESNGTYTVVASTKNLTIRFNDQSMAQPDTSATKVSMANGEIIDFTSDVEDSHARVMAEFNNFVYPDHAVSVGDEWKANVEADSKKGTVAMTRSYKVDSLEKIGDHDTAKIKIDYKETSGPDPVSREGYVWIDTQDGSQVKSETEWGNLPTPQGPIGAKISLTRVD